MVANMLRGGGQAIPIVGLLFVGRARPGFDQAWGTTMGRAIERALRNNGFQLVEPADVVVDEEALISTLEVYREQHLSALIVCQPTIGDGLLSPSLSRHWRYPMVFWATPERPNSDTISANSLVGTHLFVSSMRSYKSEFVYGHPDEEATIADLKRAVRCVSTTSAIRRANVGLIGDHAPGFYNLAANALHLKKRLGIDLHHYELQTLLAALTKVSDAAVQQDLSKQQALGLPTEVELAPEALKMQSRYYIAFREMMESKYHTALAFRCWPELPSLTGHWPYVALARLVSEGRAIAMEGDVYGALCGLIAHELGAGPTYLCDWLEHDRNTITIWHTGAAPFQLCEPIGSPTGPRIGLQFNNNLPSVVNADIRAPMTVTLFRLWEYPYGKQHYRYRLCALEGSTIKPPQRLPGTNGVMQVEGVDVRRWFEDMLHAGMPHHVCVVEGAHADDLRRVARLLTIEWV